MFKCIDVIWINYSSSSYLDLFLCVFSGFTLCEFDFVCSFVSLKCVPVLLDVVPVPHPVKVPDMHFQYTADAVFPPDQSKGPC